MEIQKKNNIDLSIVIPTFNGSRYMQALYARLNTELHRLGRNYECIFVIDGSRDDTVHILESIGKQDNRIVIAKFDRNYGQHSAIHAGIRISQGEIVVVLNDDMVGCIGELERFINEIDKGKEVIFGWRLSRTNISCVRKMISFFINFFISLLIGIRIHDAGCGFKCFKKKVICEGRSHLELISRLKKYKFRELKIRCSESSESRYNFVKCIKLFFAIITSMFRKDTLKYHLE